MDNVYFEDLKGKTIVGFDIINRLDDDVIDITTSDDKSYRMYHEQDCCESVYVDEIIGDITDIMGEPLLMSQEIIQSNEIEHGTETWTFYKLATIKGYVTIRWYGESNGYYSESVSICEVVKR